jgi:hypothetical protein
VVGLLIAEAVIGFVTYVLGLHGKIEFNAASVLGTGLGTIFRFYAYRKWVFLAPPEAAWQAGLSSGPVLPDYPPWEFDPAFLPPERAATVLAAPVAVAAPAWHQPVPAAAWHQPARPAAWQDEPVSAAWRERPSGWDAAPARGWEPVDHSQRRTESIIPNGRVAAPHRTVLPGAGQDGRRQGSTGPMAAGPVAPPTAPRPSAGRHRKH